MNHNLDEKVILVIKDLYNRLDLMSFSKLCTLLWDNSYFNIDGKHLHTKICIEKRKLTIKDVCKKKRNKMTCQLAIFQGSFSF